MKRRIEAAITKLNAMISSADDIVRNSEKDDVVERYGEAMDHMQEAVDALNNALAALNDLS